MLSARNQFKGTVKSIKLGPYRLNSCTKSKEISPPTVGAPVPG